MENNFYNYDGKPTVKCPICNDRGWIYSRTEGIYEFYKMCICHPLYGKEDGRKIGERWRD